MLPSRCEPGCYEGFEGYRSAFLFSIETMFTIGYGNRAVSECWTPAWVVGIHSIYALVLQAVFLGIILAKISHPKGRGRTILISDCAVISRRDGTLKL